MIARSRTSLALLCLGLSAALACGGKHRSEIGDEDLDGGTPFDAAIYQPDALTSTCFGSAFRCEGQTAIPCEVGSGVEAMDCAERDQFCNPVRGCSPCVPGTTSCADGKATWCRDDGTLAEFECDSMQGLTCQPGGCRGACALNEVQDSYIGCDYYPTVTLNPVWQGFSFAIAVSNTAREPTRVTVTQGERTIKQVTVAGDALETIELPWVSMLKGGDVTCTDPPPPGATRIAKDGAYRVRTDRPVTVYQFSPLEYRLGKTRAEIPTGCPVIDPMQRQCVPHNQLPDDAKCLSYSNDASLLLPANALTNSYTALSWPSQSEQGKSTGSSFVAVTATEDGTVLEVRSAQEIEPGAGLPKSGNGKVTLDRGDVLELVAGTDKDLSGTRLRSDKPVQVIAGQSCAYVPDSATGTCDHLEEAMLPEDTLGANYVITMPVLLTFPQDLTPTPYVVRLSAILDKTTIKFDPEVHAPITLGAGEVRDLVLEGTEIKNVLAKANRPFQVATFMVGQEALPGGSILGDPSMSLAIPVEQFRTSYLFTAPTTYDLNFATVIAKQGTTVRIDGVLLVASDFTAVGDSDYRVAQVLLDDAKAVHTLSASDEVGLTVYGYGWYTSYMYPGGADLDRITVPPIL
jgi:hypothetical protein